MQLKQKIEKYTVITVISFLFLWGCEETLRREIGGFAGSYPFVEAWELNINENDLIEIIKELKKEDKTLQPPGDTALTHGRSSYWYYISFYYPDTKEVVHTWTRPDSDSDSTKTTLAFYSLTDLGRPKEHKLINKDFWYLPNRRQIKKFERTIVDRIKNKIEQKKNGT